MEDRKPETQGIVKSNKYNGNGHEYATTWGRYLRNKEHLNKSGYFWVEDEGVLTQHERAESVKDLTTDNEPEATAESSSGDQNESISDQNNIEITDNKDESVKKLKKTNKKEK